MSLLSREDINTIRDNIINKLITDNNVKIIQKPTTNRKIINLYRDNAIKKIRKQTSPGIRGRSKKYKLTPFKNTTPHVIKND
ncbi:MAG: hypothetical protein ACW98X_12135 [Promethearchaeota archaeon]|jgi:hypothetical protein